MNATVARSRRRLVQARPRRVDCRVAPFPAARDPATWLRWARQPTRPGAVRCHGGNDADAHRDLCATASSATMYSIPRVVYGLRLARNTAPPTSSTARAGSLPALRPLSGSRRCPGHRPIAMSREEHRSAPLPIAARLPAMCTILPAAAGWSMEQCRVESRPRETVAAVASAGSSLRNLVKSVYRCRTKPSSATSASLARRASASGPRCVSTSRRQLKRARLARSVAKSRW